MPQEAVLLHGVVYGFLYGGMYFCVYSFGWLFQPELVGPKSGGQNMLLKIVWGAWPPWF